MHYLDPICFLDPLEGSMGDKCQTPRTICQSWFKSTSTVKYCCLRSIYFLHHWFRVTNINRQLLLSRSPPGHFLALAFTFPPSSVNVEAAFSIFNQYFLFVVTSEEFQRSATQSILKRFPACCRLVTRGVIVHEIHGLTRSWFCTFLV